ncbi:MAG: hypothetical protein PHH11_01215 [Methylomonas sp.]|nr:hypothetical protein [Methylomonas sp.]
MPPPDLRLLYDQAQQSPPGLTIENLQEEEHIFNEQVATARQWLDDKDTRRRIAGAEQLGAYPTAEAEIALNDALIFDSEAKVRAAAALSLAGFLPLDEMSIKNLLAALGDSSQDVQLNALHTLNRYLLKQEANTLAYQQLISALTQKAKAKELTGTTRQSLEGLLLDLK